MGVGSQREAGRECGPVTDETSYGTVEQRVDALDRALLTLTEQLRELQHEVTLLPSIQRLCMDIDARVVALERQYAALLEYIKGLRTHPAPLPYPPVHQPFGSVNGLVTAVEGLFDCRDGDHRAGHRVDTKVYFYTTLGLIASAAVPDAPERLRQALYKAFQILRKTCTSKRPMLYWRYAKEERILEDAEKLNTELSRYKIMTRVAIPEADFSAVAYIIKAGDGIYTVLEE